MQTITFVLAALGILLGTSLLWRWLSRRRQLPYPAWLGWFLDNPLTDMLGGTQTTLDRIGLQPGEHGLDVGSGPGRLSLSAAQRVIPAGTVTALDIQPAMLARLEYRARQLGLDNIILQLADISSENGLPTNHFDRAWMVTVLGEIPDRQAALKNLYRVLRPGSTLSVTEILIDPHYQSRSTVLQLCQSAGFKSTRYWGNWLAFTQNFVKPNARYQDTDTPSHLDKVHTVGEQVAI